MAPLSKAHPHPPADSQGTRRAAHMGASTLFQHAVCVYDTATGRVVPATSAANLVCAGIAPQTYLADDYAPGTPITLKWQDPLLHISATDPFDVTHEGQTVYMEDDHTVAKTSGGGARSKLGKLIQVKDGLALVKLIDY